jgi:hypothetical protein
MKMHPFNEQASSLAQASEAKEMQLVWVVPPSIFQKFDKQNWLNTHNKPCKPQIFASAVKQIVVEVDVATE